MSRWPITWYDDLAEKLDRKWGWDKLPLPVAMLVLIGLRNILRGQEPLRHRSRAARQAEHRRPPALPDRAHARRHLQQPRGPADGQPRQPLRPQRPARVHGPGEGPARAESAHRQPRAADAQGVHPGDDAQPARRRVDPVRGARLVQPRPERGARTRGRSSLADDDPWPQHPMEIQRTRRDPSADADGPPTFVTADTHWWDGSQVYGNEPTFAQALRTGENGKLKLDDRGLIPEEVEAHVDLVGVAGNFWVGLALLHSLFMREHNAVCDHLHATHPEKTDDELYDNARLVVAALMAKIHTVDWTPAIIAHPTTVKALHANWWGVEGRDARQAARPDHRERGDPRHPRDEDGSARRPVSADRGVRRRLPDAPADPRRFRLPRARRRQAAPAAHAAGPRGAPGAAAADRDVDERRLLLVRDHASGRAHAAQLPALPPGLPPRGRGAHRPRLDRRPARTRARRARATTSSAGCSTSRRTTPSRR